LLVVLKKRGIRTSRSALWRFFGRHDITFKKKSLCASERQRQDVVRARRKWIREQGLLDPARQRLAGRDRVLQHANRSEEFVPIVAVGVLVPIAAGPPQVGMLVSDRGGGSHAQVGPPIDAFRPGDVPDDGRLCRVRTRHDP
jgi:hypothetical protein